MCVCVARVYITMLLGEVLARRGMTSAVNRENAYNLEPRRANAGGVSRVAGGIIHPERERERISRTASASDAMIEQDKSRECQGV